ncbi:N-methyl-L-tryptophan oxidase [Deinococcus marmoris]|uniref:N-methyl-L-tryptophan oxidase n=1 Tax=Deinococcus marmoris TaxID=249408 RepID=UPI000691633B|nr:N-methyl-L-tryptophan oxidase [Deinococcus marmoris]
MKTSYDTIIVGGGMAGIAGAHELARRGQQVLLLEQFAFGHERGSSAGPSRIFRLSQTVREYAPMAARALTLWKQFQSDYATQLYWPAGLLDLGDAHTPMLTEIQTHLREGGQDFEVLDAPALARRYPQWRPGDDWQAVYSPEAGILNPSLTLELLTAMAGVLGATLLDRTSVLSVDLSDPAAPTVHTARGTFSAGRLVVAAGAWLPGLVPDLAPSLRVTQEQVAFFRPTQPEAFALGRFPLFIHHQLPEAYGFPLFHLPGIKVGLHASGPQVDPDTRDGLPQPELTGTMRAFLEDHLPSAAGPVMQVKTCLYTTTRSGDFIYDTHPDSARVLLVSACSGVGFKFLPVHGEIIADWSAGRRHPLLTRRFGLAEAAPPFASPG